MFRITRARVAVAVALLSMLFGFGVWMLLHPASIWVQPWRAQQSPVQGNVMFGPYPTEEDFIVLKGKGVTTIVSLLNPAVPYEKVLLEQERERARRHGIRLLNFPMGSILGQKFGADYRRNSRAAAQAALDSRGTAYIHCYLGINRAKNVQRYLHTLAPSSTNYAGTSGSLEDGDAFQRGRDAYKAGHYEAALSEFARMKVRNVQALRMEAWSNFRLNRIPEAQAAFERIRVELPGNADAASGLGYCALRMNDLPVAERYFAQAMAAGDGDVAAIEGMGYVRLRQQRRAEASALFERALTANPANEETRAALSGLSDVAGGASPAPVSTQNASAATARARG